MKVEFNEFEKNSILPDNRGTKIKNRNRHNSVNTYIQIEQKYLNEGLTDEDLRRGKLYGIIIILGVMIYFIGGIGSLFNIWVPMYYKLKSNIFNLPVVPSIQANDDWPVENYYAYVIILCPVIFWIWCIVSWVGMKLFRHAKGIANA